MPAGCARLQLPRTCRYRVKGAVPKCSRDVSSGVAVLTGRHLFGGQHAHNCRHAASLQHSPGAMTALVRVRVPAEPPARLCTCMFAAWVPVAACDCIMAATCINDRCYLVSAGGLIALVHSF